MSGIRTLFFALAALALSLVLLQPLCSAAHPAVHSAGDAKTCCASVTGSGAAKLLDQTIDATPKPLAVLPVLPYLLGAAFILAGMVRSASPVPPPRAFYARSARILR